MKKDALIIVRGGGDLATGTIHRLCSAGLRVLVLETTQPAAIRRQVALCEAVYEGEATVEGLRAVRIEALEQAQSVWAQGAVPVLVDPEGACIARAKPEVVVDAILAKRNLGTALTGTLQIGEPSYISEALGCPVVSDFRVRDMAAGGQGAPLVPYTEFLLYRDPDATVGLQNLGGIGNLTILPRGGALEDTYAFDTGPGNMVMDQLVFRLGLF